MCTAVALIALSLGCKVFVDAQKEKKGLKRLGEIVGAVVMIVAFVCVLHGVAKCGRSSQCSMISKGMNCLMSDTGTAAATTAKPTCPMGRASDFSK